MAADTDDQPGQTDGEPTPSNLTLGMGVAALVALFSFPVTSLLGPTVGLVLGVLTCVVATAELQSTKDEHGHPFDIPRYERARMSRFMGVVAIVAPPIALIGLMVLVATGQLD